MEYSKEQIQENRKKWLDHLRAPGTQKHRSELECKESPEKRCCLGHACHVLGLDREYDVHSCRVLYMDEKGDTSSSSLPIGAQEMLGIRTARGTFIESVPAVIRYGTSKTAMLGLAMLNDTTYLTMAQIADVIEEQFEKGNFVGDVMTGGGDD